MAEHSETSSPASTESPAISDVKHQDISVLMNPGSERNQPMAGFDDDYVDIVDYIVRCTHKIWEGRGLGLIESHYAHNVVIHTSDGMTMERSKVIADSAKTMAAFPDIRLYADDVIWSGNDQDGFHSSHRITWTGTNSGYSVYGKPTRRKVVRQGIAHCFVKANRVVEEWICRDELALVLQLGFDPIELAKAVTAKAYPQGMVLATGEVERLRGQMPVAQLSDAEASDPEGFVRAMFHNVWNRRMIGAIDHYYAPHSYARVPGHRMIYGLGDVKAYLLSIIAAFPDLALVIDHQCMIGNERDGYRVASRWFLHGTHEGNGIYGEPTGRPICIWGISHHEIREAKIEREWMIFDVFAILKQLYAPGA